MAFNSFQYFVFLAGTVFVYRRVSFRLQNGILLLASYGFYAAASPRYLPLLALSTFGNYWSGRLLAQDRPESLRRRMLAVSVFLNLAVLATFKYLGFFARSSDEILERLGFSLHVPVVALVVPLALSFYTFHAISYVVDVYRRDVEASDDPVAFAVFLAFFPQVVAGPIGRAQIQLQQFSQPRDQVDRASQTQALNRIAVGIFRKVVIADGIAPVVDAATSAEPTVSTLFVLAVAFGIQIYADFAGYSDIAIGSARLFGIDIPENFRQPYFARNLRDFWRRWHISLSTWLRDYLYIPLGGSAGGPRRTTINLFITMLLGGMWHGADTGFIVWGALHGLALGAERAAPGRLSSAVARARSLAVITLLWLPFRLPSLEAVGTAFQTFRHLELTRPANGDLVLIAFAGLVTFLLDWRNSVVGPDELLGRNPRVRGAVLGLMGCAIVLFSGNPPHSFIYFQF